MAIAYQSVSTQTYVSRDTTQVLTITKPSGLSVGDLMIVHLVMSGIGGYFDGIIFTNTGWFSLDNSVNSFSYIADSAHDVAIHAAYKIANSSDVAASGFDFGFTGGAGTVNVAGSIYRINGHDAGVPISAWLSGAVENDKTPSYGTGITPEKPSCLFLMLNALRSALVGTYSNYAITTDNPSWSEVYYEENFSNSSFSGAIANRPESTGTGAWSFTVTNGGVDGDTDTVSIILAIQPQMEINVVDIVNITENVILLNSQLGNLNIIDILSIVESVISSNSQLTGINVNDALSITEYSELTFIMPITLIVDTLSITESLTIQNPTNYANVFDTLTITESITTSLSQLGGINVNNTLTITEYSDVTQILINVTDTLAITENITLSEADGVSSIETLTISESITIESFRFSPQLNLSVGQISGTLWS